ncbi:hypothetical protein C3L33_06343, partial [Rhododendron williamsianum]
MDILHSATQFPTIPFLHPHRPSASVRHLRRCLGFTVRSSLPFPDQNAKYHRELRAAVGAVERACRLCVDVKKSLFSSDGRILEKNDQTPVTVADFGVQALISLGYPVRKGDCNVNRQVRVETEPDAPRAAVSQEQGLGTSCWGSPTVMGHLVTPDQVGKLFPSIPLVAEEDSAFLRSSNLVNSVVDEVTDKASFGDKQLMEADVLEAIDRGGKDAFSFGRIIMVAHVGCGTWTKQLSFMLGSTTEISNSWTRCSVDRFDFPPFVEAQLLTIGIYLKISNEQNWGSTFLGSLRMGNKLALLLLGRVFPIFTSLCKYLMVASGWASVFILRARAQTIIKVWDHAAGMICVHEAGGKVTDWRGNELDLSVDQVERRFISPTGGVLVTNSSLHTKLLELISSG